MYHSTMKTENVSSILRNGFKISQKGSTWRPGLLLGDGVYVTRDIEKTIGYGDVCFKLLVYPGKTFIVDDDTPQQERVSWQREHSSAWIPPNNRVHPSGREETCVKSPSQVRILETCLALVIRLIDENRILDMMLEDLGIVYSTLVHQGSMMLLQASGRNRAEAEEWNGCDNQLWSRTWDNCLENKATGKVLTAHEGSDEVTLTPVEAAGDKSQKWRLDPKGRFVHKASNRVVSVVGRDEIRLKSWNEGDRESWRFRCLDETRTHDTFVNYTPWQNMVSWE